MQSTSHQPMRTRTITDGQGCIWLPRQARQARPTARRRAINESAGWR